MSDSAAQSEFAEFHQCTRSMLWLRNVMKFLQFDQEKPRIIFADSSTGIDVAMNPGSAEKRSKHWNPKLFLVKEAQENGDIDLHKIPGQENPADATTKALLDTPHEMHLANSGYVTMVPKEGIEGAFMVCQKCKESKSVEVASANARTVKFENQRLQLQSRTWSNRVLHCKQKIGRMPYGKEIVEQERRMLKYAPAR